MTSLKVEQVDREAAVGYLYSGKQPVPADIEGMASDIREQRGDDYQIVQAFARHRAAGKREGLSEAEERNAALSRCVHDAAMKLWDVHYIPGNGQDGRVRQAVSEAAKILFEHSAYLDAETRAIVKSLATAIRTEAANV